MTNITVPQSATPAYVLPKTASTFGNTSEADIILPRVKLLQGLSAEPAQYPLARAGEYWHTLAEESFGTGFTVVPIHVRKTFILWAPRNADELILAVARDGVHWDNPNGEWSVKYPKAKRPVTLRTARTVEESGLHLRGTTDPDDPKSPPAAAETYEFVFVRPDRFEYGPFLMTHQRSSAKVAKQLLSKIRFRPGEPFCQCYTVSAFTDKSQEGSFYNTSYTASGYVDESLVAEMKSLHDRFAGSDYRAADTGEDDGMATVAEPSKF